MVLTSETERESEGAKAASSRRGLKAGSIGLDGVLGEGLRVRDCYIPRVVNGILVG